MQCDETKWLIMINHEGWGSYCFCQFSSTGQNSILRTEENYEIPVTVLGLNTFRMNYKLYDGFKLLDKD